MSTSYVDSVFRKDLNRFISSIFSVISIFILSFLFKRFFVWFDWYNPFNSLTSLSSSLDGLFVAVWRAETCTNHLQYMFGCKFIFLLLQLESSRSNSIANELKFWTHYMDVDGICVPNGCMDVWPLVGEKVRQYGCWKGDVIVIICFSCSCSIGSLVWFFFVLFQSNYRTNGLAHTVRAQLYL